MGNLQPFGIETTTVGLMLYNPTNEDFNMQYAGVSLTMRAGEKTLFEIACAKHLLNSFGPRGLSSLQYGADEDKVKRDGQQRNKDFKKRMVTEYNQRNENRKMAGLGYHPPTPEITQYAIELGLQLLEPYAVRDEERNDLSSLKQENIELKGQMGAMMEKFNELMDQLNKRKGPGRKTVFACDCGEEFEYQTGLDNHRLKCKGVSG